MTKHAVVIARGLALRQEGIERTLAAWVEELTVSIYRGLEVTGFAQDDTGVDVALSDGRSLRAMYLVGCADRVQRVDARYAGVWELPVLGAVAAPTSVLIRPDGHVAWSETARTRGSVTP